jgi:hypothetical protein
LSQVDVEGILQDVDTDHDGRINYEEFCNCMRVRAVRTLGEGRGGEGSEGKEGGEGGGESRGGRDVLQQAHGPLGCRTTAG